MDKKEHIEQRNLSFRRMVQSYWKSARSERRRFAGVLIAYTLATLGGGTVTPLVYKRIIDIVTQSGSRADVAPLLFQSLWILIGVVAFYQAMYRIGDFLISSAESRTMQALNQRAFTAFLRQGYTFFSDRFTGSLVAQARRYTRTFQEATDILLYHFWMPGVALLGMIVALFFIKPVLGAILLAWIPLYIVIAIWLTRKKLPYDAASAAQDSVVTASFADVLSNILAVMTFAAGRREAESFSKVAAEDQRVRLRASIVNNLLIAVLTLLFSLLEITVMYVVIRLWLTGSVSAGTVVLVQIYTGAVFFELFGLGRSFGKLMKSTADATEMIDILERKDQEIGIARGVETFRLGKGEVVFSNVSFRYENGGAVFQDFTLKIRPGEKIGLVGPSGAGKSTLTKLLLRFVLPTGGAVRIDGTDIATVSGNDLREAIAYVPQETALFHRSIAENIAYGKPGATPEEIREAAKKAHADEFIEALPKKYETLVGERGVKLSGGERQRVAIARAILKGAPILVLDEATSSLDSESEYAIQAALDELMKGKTAIVIAHRLSTVRKLDRIIVLDKDGRIEGEGTHDELLQKDGLYAQLWNRQTGGFISEGDEEERGAAPEGK